MWPMILTWLLKPKNLVIVAVAGALLVLGGSTVYYKSKAKTLAEKLKAIEIAAKNAEDELKKTKGNIDKLIAKGLEESRKREQEEKKKGEDQRKKLEVLLANQGGRIAALTSRLRSVDEERERIKKESETATGKHEADLQEKGKKFQSLKDQLEKERAGLVCLEKNVPNDEVRVLNEVLNK